MDLLAASFLSSFHVESLPCTFMQNKLNEI